MSVRLPRKTYADLYGPTTGDRVRLADTELIIEVEKDFTSYGDEITFGGGKVIRDGMGQSSTVSARVSQPGALDLVITNALIVDHWGIVKGDIGVRNGRIVKVGKAGNPDTMAGVDPELVVGASTLKSSPVRIASSRRARSTATSISFRRSKFTRRYRTALQR